MTKINLRATKFDVSVDCNLALKNGISRQLIIDRMERCSGAKYFQDWENWEHVEFPYLKLIQDDRRICGSKHVADNVLSLNWYQLTIEPSAIQKKLSQETKFDKELL